MSGRYYIDPAGRARDAETRRYVARAKLATMTEVPAPAPPTPPAEAPREDAPPPPEQPMAEPTAEPAPEPMEPPPERPMAEPMAEPAPEPMEPPPEPTAEPMAEPAGWAFDEWSEPAETPPPAPSGPVEHAELCPAQSSRATCACGASYTEVPLWAAEMTAGAVDKALDLAVAMAAKRPVASWDLLARPEVRELVGIGPAEIEAMRRAEAEAWRRVLAKYGGDGGRYAAEIALVGALASGAILRMGAGAALAAEGARRREAQGAADEGEA